MRFLGITLGILVLSLSAFAEESEFKGKMQEDLDGYVSQITSACGAAVKAEWAGGKLGHNPRESEKPEWNALSTLCTTALDSMTQACSGNEAVKKALKGVKTVQCLKGKGPIAYKRKGNSILFTVDPSFTTNNPAGQGSDLVTKLKKDLDT